MKTTVILTIALLVGAAAADTSFVTVGSPVAPNAIPFWGQTYQEFRLQWLYYASEIGQSGEIACFDLWGANNLAVDYYNVRVLLCHTDRNAMSNEFDLNYAGNTPVEVLAADTLTVGYGSPTHWYRFPAGFEYDNAHNLIVEIRWRGSAGANVAFWRNDLGSIPRRVFAYEYDARFGATDTVMANYVRFGLVSTGLAEPGPGFEPAGFEPALTVAGTSLHLPAASPGGRHTLFDHLGRQLMELAPGANDVRRLSPGVYFLRSAGADGPRPAARVRKVVLLR